MAAQTQLDIAAARLRNADPRAFEEFVALYQVRLSDLFNSIINASSADILVKQGQAQEATAMIRILKECHTKQPPKPTPQASPQ